MKKHPRKLYAWLIVYLAATLGIYLVLPTYAVDKQKQLNSALFDAMGRSDHLVVRNSLNQGADPNARFDLPGSKPPLWSRIQNLFQPKDTRNERSALVFATMWGCTECTTLLIEHGANVNEKPVVSPTPLYFAMTGSGCFSGGGPDALKMTRLLLEHGANPNQWIYNSQLPLEYARELAPSHEFVALLRKYGAR
jgi:ankyrin repeat protein